MTTFTDDFNRADSSDLGAGWVEVSGDWSIISNQLSTGVTGGTIALRAATAMASNDNYAQTTIAATTSVSQGVWCRGNADITDGYVWRNNGSNWTLFSVVADVFTSIGSHAAAAAPGDVAKVQAVGSTIKGFVNGVERVSVTNTDVATGTSVGIRSEANSALRFDDFTGADVSGAVTGSAAAVFGGLTGAASGIRTVSGIGAASFGALGGAATGTRRVDGTAASGFGGMSGAASGTREVVGTAAFAGGALTGGVVGVRTVVASAVATFGGLTGTAIAPSHINGSAAAVLGALTAAAQGSVPVVPGQSSGWRVLTSIYTEATAYARRERTEPPQACPYDGEPLSTTPDGHGLFCKFDGYQWPQDRRII